MYILLCSDEADGDSSCKCTEPCERVIYDPAPSNAALSSLSIESILAVKREVLQVSWIIVGAFKSLLHYAVFVLRWVGKRKGICVGNTSIHFFFFFLQIIIIIKF